MQVYRVTLDSSKRFNAWMQHIALKAAPWSPAPIERKIQYNALVLKIRDRQGDTVYLTEDEAKLTQSYGYVARRLEVV